MKTDIEKALAKIEFENREDNRFHTPYDKEIEFYQTIKMGNVEEAMQLLRPFNSDGMGVLSEDKLRNLKYHLIISIAFITRYCIEGGMEMEEAYNRSDIYIRRLDGFTKEEEIESLHMELVEAYAKRMRSIRKKTMYSKAIILCLEYIYANLHTKITLEVLAEQAKLSPTYLSKLFHKEVGVSVSQYITQKRIEAAEKMLRYTEFSSAEIANCLCFCSESHFIATFKRYVKVTPREYREQQFRTK
ncbi:MAG: helix-turn-helix transcriptional regulator [Lachnospiraceae bacterium]|nr:helix-turn-helix transcriptional regulator [Lachnospiraceae bacterium]